MRISNNNHKELIVTPEIKIDFDKKLIFNKYYFCYAKDDHELLVVGETTFENILKEIKECI